MSDAVWEIAATLAVGAGVIAFLAYHKGAETPTSAPSQPLTAQPLTAQDYNPTTDYANGFNLSPFAVPPYTPPNINYTTSFPINITSGPTISLNLTQEIIAMNAPLALGLVPVEHIDILQNFSFPIQNTVVNVSSGTPSCGCNSGAIQTANDAAIAQARAYNDTLAALSSLASPQPTTSINVNLSSPIKKYAMSIVTGVGDFVQLGGGETLNTLGTGTVFGGTGG